AAAQRGHGHLDRKFGPVTTQGSGLVALHRHRAIGALGEVCEALRESLAIVLRDGELHEPLPNDFATRPAEHGFRLTIPITNDSSLVQLDEAVDRRLENAESHLLTVNERFARLLAFSHVAADEVMTLLGFGPDSAPCKR